MEDKNENVFTKLDRQEEKIDNISSKLEGVSLTDLYALAKRTYDSNDFKMAQQYYNHISVNYPLEWKAPMLASLCTYKIPTHYDDYLYFPFNRNKIYISTIKYILERDISILEKNKNLEDALKMINEDIEIEIDEYLRNKEGFDKYCKDYNKNTQQGLFDLIKNYEQNENELIIKFRNQIISSLLDLIKKSNNMVLCDIKEEDFRHILELASIDNKDDILKNINLRQNNEVHQDIITKENNRDSIKNLVIKLLILFINILASIFFIVFIKKSNSNIWVIVLYSFNIFLSLVSIYGTIKNRKQVRKDSIFRYPRVRQYKDKGGNIKNEVIIFSIPVLEMILCFILFIASLFKTTKFNGNTYIFGFIFAFGIFIRLLSISLLKD